LGLNSYPGLVPEGLYPPRVVEDIDSQEDRPARLNQQLMSGLWSVSKGIAKPIKVFRPTAAHALSTPHDHLGLKNVLSWKNGLRRKGDASGPIDELAVSQEGLAIKETRDRLDYEGVVESFMNYDREGSIAKVDQLLPESRKLTVGLFDGPVDLFELQTVGSYALAEIITGGPGRDRSSNRKGHQKGKASHHPGSLAGLAVSYDGRRGSVVRGRFLHKGFSAD
jgi:hypothetical protein